MGEGGGWRFLYFIQLFISLVVSVLLKVFGNIENVQIQTKNNKKQQIFGNVKKKLNSFLDFFSLANSYIIIGFEFL